MNVTTDQWKCERARIADVLRCVHQALRKPDADDTSLEPLATFEEVSGKQRQEQELSKRSAQEVSRLSKNQLNHMTGFVQKQIHAVEKVITIGKDQPEDVWNEQCDQAPATQK